MDLEVLKKVLETFWCSWVKFLVIFSAFWGFVVNVAPCFVFLVSGLARSLTQ